MLSGTAHICAPALIPENHNKMMTFWTHPQHSLQTCRTRATECLRREHGKSTTTTLKTYSESFCYTKNVSMRTMGEHHTIPLHYHASPSLPNTPWSCKTTITCINTTCNSAWEWTFPHVYHFIQTFGHFLRRYLFPALPHACLRTLSTHFPGITVTSTWYTHALLKMVRKRDSNYVYNEL